MPEFCKSLRHTHSHARTHTCIHTLTHTRTHTRLHTHTNTHMQIYIYKNRHTERQIDRQTNKLIFYLPGTAVQSIAVKTLASATPATSKVEPHTLFNDSAVWGVFKTVLGCKNKNVYKSSFLCLATNLLQTI